MKYRVLITTIILAALMTSGAFSLTLLSHPAFASVPASTPGDTPPQYPVNIAPIGIPEGSTWYFSYDAILWNDTGADTGIGANGWDEVNNSTSLNVYLRNGTYYYFVGATGRYGYIAMNNSSVFSVNGRAVTEEPIVHQINGIFSVTGEGGPGPNGTWEFSTNNSNAPHENQTRRVDTGTDFAVNTTGLFSVQISAPRGEVIKSITAVEYVNIPINGTNKIQTATISENLSYKILNPTMTNVTLLFDYQNVSNIEHFGIRYPGIVIPTNSGIYLYVEFGPPAPPAPHSYPWWTLVVIAVMIIAIIAGIVYERKGRKEGE